MKHSQPVMYAGCAAVLGLLAAPASAETAFVTNNANAGPGSFRQAVLAANTDPEITSILFGSDLGTIALRSTVTYTGAQPLSIDGEGTEISSEPPQGSDLFAATGGGDLTLRNLTFRDGDNGVLVEIPASAEGQVSVQLFDVTVVDNLRFGLSIDEDDPMPGQPFAASISLVVASSHFARNGLLDTDDEDEGDVDAVRVNERGDGHIIATVIGSQFVDNGADGFELDEEGPGDATLIAIASAFDDNGATRVGGDDGLDIDESDDGSIWLNVVDSTFNASMDDGIGLDEAGAGDLHITLVEVAASGNADSGISADEGDEGNYEVVFVQVIADDNLDKGADMTEAGDGNFAGRAEISSFSSNADDDIAVEQLDAGTGILHLVDVMFDTIDADGVEVIVDGSPL